MMPGGKHQTMLHNNQMGATHLQPDGSAVGTIHPEYAAYNAKPLHQATYPSLDEAQKDIEARLKAPRVLSQQEIEDRGINSNGESQRISEYNRSVLNPQKVNKVDNQFFDNLDHTALQGKTPKAMTLYRGVNMTNPVAQSQFGGLKPGDTVGGDKPLFSSASEDPVVAHAFATDAGAHNQAAVMAIHTPKGFPTLKMPDYENEDYMRPWREDEEEPQSLGLERERLFPRGTAFHVTKTEQMPSIYDGNPITLHHVTPSHPSFNQAPKLAAFVRTLNA
jgi:hypothetical protein